MAEDLDALRRKKLLELQQRAQDEKYQEAQKQQLDLQKRSVLMEVLTPEARSRLANVKLARPEYAIQIENLVIQLAQTGQIRQKITDEQLKQILRKISAKRKDITIRRV
ncbi:MAG: DNA-binding protein [Candidatus Hydrothermarchaeota archaeon]